MAPTPGQARRARVLQKQDECQAYGSVLAHAVVMDDLRTRIHEYIRDGLLASDQCLIAWYGPGRGQICEACTGRILGSEVAVECELRGGAVIWFHASCYGLWHSMLGGCARG